MKTIINNNLKNKDVLVLFSGGQDSTTCLYWAKKHFRKVYSLCFSYGQRHSQEIENAQKIAKIADVNFQILDVNIFSNLAPNSLINKSINMDENQPIDSYPNTFVPGRNMIFITLAAAIAYSKDISHIVTGVSEADYSGYPDCRNDFIKSVNTSINLAMDRQFHIHTPLMWKNKAQVWQLADELGIFDLVRKNTLTCYNGILADGCGNCPACKLRENGLKEYLTKQ